MFVHTMQIPSLRIQTNLRNARFAQCILTLRENLRNPGIARQSTDSNFALRKPRIAQIPIMRGTYTCN